MGGLAVKYQMGERAKNLTENEKKLIYNFIYSNAIGNEKEKWAQGWYNACLADDAATDDMLRLARGEKISSPSPTLVQDTVTYANW